MRTLKKWPLLYRHYSVLNGRPHQERVRVIGTRISTEAIWANCAGSDSPDHIKDIQHAWPELTEAQIRQAIAFERTQRLPQPGKSAS
jgi:uncharacterized protein (DUF433 family)